MENARYSEEPGWSVIGPRTPRNGPFWEDEPRRRGPVDVSHGRPVACKAVHVRLTILGTLMVSALLAGCSDAPRAAQEQESVRVVRDRDDTVQRGPGLPARGRSCHTRIESGHYSYSSLAAVKHATCATTVRTFTALLEQVIRRTRAGEDCYPAFCALDSPMRSRGFRCTHMGLGDGLARVICQRGRSLIDAAALADH